MRVCPSATEFLAMPFTTWARCSAWTSRKIKLAATVFPRTPRSPIQPPSEGPAYPMLFSLLRIAILPTAPSKPKPRLLVERRDTPEHAPTPCVSFSDATTLREPRQHSASARRLRAGPPTFKPDLAGGVAALARKSQEELSLALLNYSNIQSKVPFLREAKCDSVHTVATTRQKRVKKPTKKKQSCP